MGQRAVGREKDDLHPIYRRGHADGQRWAKLAASIAKLERLRSLQEAIRGDWSGWGTRPWAWQEMACRINGSSGHEWDECAQFWSKAAGADWQRPTADPDYLRGFAEGALAEYDSQTANLGHA